MIPIYQSWLIQIEITNACTHRCANCTRFVGHYRKPYFMSLDEISRAIDSLEGFGGGIGIMGGEPTLHPDFPAICELLRKKVSPWRCGLWTSGYRWKEYRSLIKRTFKFAVNYNDHSNPDQKHQPVLVAIDDVVQNKDLMWKLIDRCWVQEWWSPSINHKGGFFCEVAAALDILFEGPGGYRIEKGWWNRTTDEFHDQVERYCRRCGAALPLSCSSHLEDPDLVSPSNLELLKKVGSPKAAAGRYQIFDRVIDNEIGQCSDGWDPAIPPAWPGHANLPRRSRCDKWDPSGQFVLSSHDASSTRTAGDGCS